MGMVVLAGCNGQAAWCILTMFKKILQPFEQSLAGVLSSSGFKMKPGKCRIFQNKVPFLGHIVSESGIVTDPMKTEQIANWPLPTTCQVQQFSGLANYYWRVILGFAQIAKPLYHLTEKNMPFKWTSGCQDAFETLQCKLVTAPILGFLGCSKTFILDTDASDGAVILQVEDNEKSMSLPMAAGYSIR